MHGQQNIINFLSFIHTVLSLVSVRSLTRSSSLCAQEILSSETQHFWLSFIYFITSSKVTCLTAVQELHLLEIPAVDMMF